MPGGARGDRRDRDRGLLAQVAETGAWLASAVEGLGLPQIAHVRGRGLLLGIVLTEDLSREIALTALGDGFLVNARGRTSCGWRRR